MVGDVVRITPVGVVVSIGRTFELEFKPEPMT